MRRYTLISLWALLFVTFDIIIVVVEFFNHVICEIPLCVPESSIRFPFFYFCSLYVVIGIILPIIALYSRELYSQQYEKIVQFSCATYSDTLNIPMSIPLKRTKNNGELHRGNKKKVQPKQIRTATKAMQN